MIIDCHGHFTTVPRTLHAWREKQLASASDPARAPKKSELSISDDEPRNAIERGQLKLQKERGGDPTMFSPIAGQMAHHLGNEQTSLVWAEVCNDLIYRVCQLFSDNFAPVCQLPQSPAASPKRRVPELRRCAEELGFVGCNLNPDPSGGYWKDPPLTDRWWYPLYEELVRLDVPAMVHVSHAIRTFMERGALHQYRLVEAGLAPLPQQLEPVPIRKAQIEHDGVVAGLAERIARAAARTDPRYCVRAISQRLLEKCADAALIFDNEDFRGGHLLWNGATEIIPP